MYCGTPQKHFKGKKQIETLENSFNHTCCIESCHMLFLSNVGFFQGDLSNSTNNKLAHLARYSEK